MENNDTFIFAGKEASERSRTTEKENNGASIFVGKETANDDNGGGFIFARNETTHYHVVRKENNDAFAFTFTGKETSGRSGCQIASPERRTMVR